MNKSPEIGELAKAMSSLQSEIRDAEKDTQGYGYKYADLSQVLCLVRPLLKKNGLAFTQHVGHTTSDAVIIETMVMHESGQWMSSEIVIPVTMESKRSAAQCVGIAVTYGRRYGLTAIMGITQTAEDQDAHAEKSKPDAKPEQPKKPKAEPAKLSDFLAQQLTVIQLQYGEDDKLSAVELWSNLDDESKTAIWAHMAPEIKKWIKSIMEKAPKFNKTDYASV